MFSISHQLFLLARQIFFLLLIVLITACVAVPYEPEATVSRTEDENAIVLDNLVLQSEPEELIKELTSAITDNQELITVMPAKQFLSETFKGKPANAELLLNEDHCANISRDLGIEYIVLLGSIKKISYKEEGKMVFMGGFFGAGQQEFESRVSAIIINIKDSEVMCGIHSTSRGKSSGAGFIYAVIILADTNSGALKGLAQEISNQIMKESNQQPATISILGVDNPLLNEIMEDTSAP